jgi:sulfur-carrier protein
VRVRIPTPLRSYTANQTTVEATGDTVGDVLFDLDRQFPGIRFRVVDEQGRLRQHMRVFVNDDFDRNLARVLVDGDELTLMQALSGG